MRRSALGVAAALAVGLWPAAAAAAAPAAVPWQAAGEARLALADAETVFCVILVDSAGNRGDGDCTAAIARLPRPPRGI